MWGFIMPILQSVLFFEQGKFGWTESYHKDIPDQDLANFVQVTRDLATKRIAFSGRETKITAIRLSKIGAFRDVAGEFTTYNGHASQDSDAPNTCLTTFMQSALRLQTKYMFPRGVWDAVIKTGGIYDPGALPSFVSRYNAWMAEVVNQSWGWMSAGNAVNAMLDGVTSNANKTVRLVFKTDLFPAILPIAAEIRLSGILGAFQLNGLQPVIPIDRKTCDTKFPVAIFPWTAGGKGRYTEKVFVAAAFVGFEKVSERKVGRPSYLTPGRARGRRRAG